MVFPFRRQKTLEEAQEENDRLGIELSIAQKRDAIKGLKARGLSLKDFGNSIRAAILYLKNH